MVPVAAGISSSKSGDPLLLHAVESLLGASVLLQAQAATLVAVLFGRLALAVSMRLGSVRRGSLRDDRSRARCACCHLRAT